MASYLKKVKDTYKSHYESDTNIQAVMTLMHGKRAVEKTVMHIGFVTFLSAVHGDTFLQLTFTTF